MRSHFRRGTYLHPLAALQPLHASRAHGGGKMAPLPTSNPGRVGGYLCLTKLSLGAFRTCKKNPLGVFNKGSKHALKKMVFFCRNSESLLTFVNTLGPNGRAGLNWLVTDVSTLPTEDAQKHGCTYSKKGTSVKAIVCSKHVTYLRKHSKDKLFSIQLRFLEHH